MRRLGMTMVLLYWSGLARAEPLPTFLDSTATERRLPTANRPLDSYRPDASRLQVSVPGAPQSVSMEARVHVRKVRFEGGTVFSLSDLRDHYQPLIGRDVSLAELMDVTRCLTQRYQREGYLLSYAYLPPQEFEDGRVRVVLVEGYIHDYQVQGEIGPARAYLDQLMARLMAERPLTRDTLERYTSLANRIPGVTFQAQVQPSTAGEEGAQLIGQVARKPYSASLQVNDGSRDDPQALLGVSSNAQTRMAEQLSASVLVPPGEEHARYYRLGYAQYLDSEGSQLQVSASRYRSEPTTRVRLRNGRDLNQRRENQRYAIGFSQPLIASSNEWLEAVARFYVARDRVDYPLTGAPFALDSETNLRVLSFEGDWRKAEARRLRMVSAGVYQGLDQFGARSNADDDLDFLRLRVSGVQSDTFTENWQGVVSAAAYWSNDSLPDSERALFGGQHFGRGYPSDQASGDKGWGLAYEVNYSFHRDGSWLKVLQPYAVLDTARAWFNQWEVQAAHMSSAALGLRFGDGRACNIAVEVAKPMADVALDSLDRRPRLTLSVSVQL
jgi:hemolysin activation/secretion protein